MKNILLTLTMGILLAGCADEKTEIIAKISDDAKTEESDNNSQLEYVDRWNQIELAQTDSKYGEWGGDTDIIQVYSDGKIKYANYLRYLGSPGPPEPPMENEEVKKWYEYKKFERKIDSVKLSDNQIELIEKAILELIMLKINTRTYPSHGGIVNEIISRDSSLIIQHYPSNQWKSFQDLKKSILEK